MMPAEISKHPDNVRVGTFSYMAETAEPSLIRNGKVLTRRDGDGSDAQWVGVDLIKQEMKVHDARTVGGAATPTLGRNGFELLNAPLSKDIDFLDHLQVLHAYYPHCEQIVREATGASIVSAFDHNVRSAAGKKSRQRIDGGQQVQGPAHVVHGDYTLTSAPQRLRDLTKPPTSNDTLGAILSDGQALLDGDETETALAAGRYGIVNVWRNIADEPVAVNPLALCDATSVKPDDLVVFEIHYADRIGENYFARHAAGHRWYFYPSMTRSEALLIKQWDSAGRMARTRGAQADPAEGDEPCTFSFHSAFEDPTTPADAPDRWSIEVRCAVIWN
ncbi:MAG: CmcJ/NvfI family oxidoreductase [Hyphomicrobiaceae bacterium]